MLNQKYLDDILVRMAYHSSGIEGNTISLPETVSIIIENTLPNQRKSIREFYEIENHKQAFQYLINALSDDANLTINLIKETHRLLTDRLQHDRGMFKTNQNAIIGAEFKTATPQETPFLMQQWADNTRYRLEQATTTDEIIEILADTHILFERIHPFSDGNGRTGRLILLFLALKYLKAPIVVRKGERAEYIELLATQDIQGLSKLFYKAYQFEQERMLEFS